MKAYLFDSLNKYKRFSENLDVKAILCNKAWEVFNDSGEKELYIFQEDGTIYITISEDVTNGTWKYIPANRSVIISANNQSRMVHPAFTDNNILAFNIDGTDKFAFFIDENNKKEFHPKTLAQLEQYFSEKEQKEIAIKKQKENIISSKVETKYSGQYTSETTTKETGTLGFIITVLLIIILCSVFAYWVSNFYFPE